MARKSSRRRSRRSGSAGIFERLASPFVEVGKATGNSFRNVGHGVGNIASKAVNTATKVGRTYVRAADKVVNNVTRGRKSKSKRTRRGSRR